MKNLIIGKLYLSDKANRILLFSKGGGRIIGSVCIGDLVCPIMVEPYGDPLWGSWLAFLVSTNGTAGWASTCEGDRRFRAISPLKQ